jgi:glycosyltransferase involved in cell wall biosynthesis
LRPLVADLVSVVVPVYNGELHLPAAIESVLAQAYSPVELLVVDDGSSDGTVQAARRYAGVRVIEQANAGPAVARNTGAEHARGRYIGFLDHDDTWLPAKVERQVQLLQKTGAGFATCHMRYVLEVEPPRWFRGPTDGTPVPGHVPSCWLLERATWERVGPFDPAYSHGCDTDWLARGRTLGIQPVVAEECLVDYRVHSQNESANASGAMGLLTSVLREHVRRKRETEA